MDSHGALKGIKVLDLGRVLAGPYCAAIMADLGADVIKIEEPGSGDDTRKFNPFVAGESAYFMQLNRNKRGITLNLKKGKDIFLKLVEKADIVVENFRPGTMKKLGLDYEELRRVNPGIIYVAVSGFGQYGPYRDWPGYDLIAQGMSGLMSVTGWPGGDPTRAGTPVCDVMGGLTATIGVLAALQHRNMTGKGQMIDVALLDSAVSSLGTVSAIYLAEGKVPQRNGNAYESAAPLDSFRANDGNFIIATGNDRMWQKLCDVMGQPELADMEEFLTNYKRVQNHEKLKRIIEEWSMTKTVDELVPALLAAGVPAGPIYTIDKMAQDQHIANARNMFAEIDHPIAGKVRLTNQPIKMSELQTGIRASSPLLGQHNEEVYMNELHLSAEEIKTLREAGTI
ncbi:MAG: CoA transferase [Negativicutes bacterium]|nr:CoA transferase [Negativicutes bacterium]